MIDDLTVHLGAPDSVLERRADAARLATEVGAVESEVAALETTWRSATAAADAARLALDTARAEEAQASTARRTAEETERVAARDLEAAIREAAWAAAQLERLEQERDRATAAVAALETDEASNAERTASADQPDDATAVEAWEARTAELRQRRDRLAEEAGVREAARREADGRRVRAETGVGLADERVARVDREVADLEWRANGLIEERESLRSELARATAAEVAAREALAEVHTADVVERDRLAEAEAAASGTRDRLRHADERLRIADRDDLEARLGLDALRESILVDLAGLGDLGVDRLAAVSGTVIVRASVDPDSVTTEEPSPERDEDTVTSELETTLDAAAAVWAASPPSEAPPGPGRLATLRRRFHELGATNPFAVDEYATLKERLETLETQGSDLRTAITRTRELIAELETMITDQFQTTFRALEAAFEARFEQLFGGGFARLSLTDPSDLGSTGVEIVARPPGKKAQALSMLSGGERALTAVALLFAMLEVRPVPFCVLDEVDAALDEANIGRFAEALRSLAHQTQFIVITHNRGTIEAADALYGVTVGDDSVSRVISLRLDEAQALAEHRRGELAPAG